MAADADENVDTLTVAIDRAWLALAAAEGSERQAQLIERVSSYDHSLLALARTLAFESEDNYPNGPLFWNDVASRFIRPTAWVNTRVKWNGLRAAIPARAATSMGSSRCATT
jgi:hypothetical protein